MLLAALFLVGLAVTKRLPLWEYVALAGLVVGMATAARHGVWVLLLAAAPAAAALSRRGRSSLDGTQPWPILRPWVPLIVCLAVAPLVLVRGDGVSIASRDTVDAIVKLAGGRIVLAPEPLVEALAVGGSRVSIANPIDAFTRADQAGYLDFLDGSTGGLRALAMSEVVVVEPRSNPEKVVKGHPDFHRQATIGGWDVYVRVR